MSLAVVMRTLPPASPAAAFGSGGAEPLEPLMNVDHFCVPASSYQTMRLPTVSPLPQRSFMRTPPAEVRWRVALQRKPPTF